VQFNATLQSTKSKPMIVSRFQKDLATISMGTNQYEAHGNATKIMIRPNIQCIPARFLKLTIF
jgi:hypothetical protein